MSALSQVDKCVVISYDRYLDLLQNKQSANNTSGKVQETAQSPPTVPSPLPVGVGAGADPGKQDKQTESASGREGDLNRPGRVPDDQDHLDEGQKSPRPGQVLVNGKKYPPPGITTEHLDSSKITGNVLQGSGSSIQSNKRQKTAHKKRKAFVWKWH